MIRILLARAITEGKLLETPPSGHAPSSLDDLGAAMAMNRPSVYGAFGDKQALYLKTLEGYRDDSVAALREVLDRARPLRDG